MDAPRFLTFTLKAMDRPLFLTITALTASFRQLRKTPEWKRHVRGGVYVIEVTRGEKGTHWHAHVHVICDGTFWQQKNMSEVWLRVTGDSRVVDIRAVHSRTSIANYVAKYVAKPTGQAEWSDAELCEFAGAMHGQRMVHTFGDSYAEEVEEPNAGEVKVLAEQLCTTNKLLHLDFKGDAYGVYAVQLLARSNYHVRTTLGNRTPPRTLGLPQLEPWEIERLVYCLRWVRMSNPDDAPSPICHWDMKTASTRDLPPAQLVLTWTPFDD